MAGAVSARLFYLQVVKGNFYEAFAKGQQEVGANIQGQRGQILAYNGANLEALAANKPEYFVYAVPKDIADRDINIAKVAAILGISGMEIDLKTQDLENLYVPIKIKLSKTEADAFKARKIPGFYLGQKTVVYYPYDNLASNILGFVDSSGAGQYGIQAKFNDCLKGREEFVKMEKGAFGYFESENQPLKGCDVVLTIDINIQKKAQELIGLAAREYQIESGQIIVMEPNTGKIIAIANYPDYNPNEYSKYAKDFRVFQNGAIERLYEPGSVFKAITMAIGINEGKVTPETTYVDSGSVKINDAIIKNYNDRVWGKRTMTEVLERSINTGVIFVKMQMSNHTFLQYFDKFGLFQPTNIDLQGEVFGRNEELRKSNDVNTATASYGQGVNMTPLRLAAAYSVIANGGKLVRPYIVDKILMADGTIKETKPVIENSEVIAPKTAETVRMMLNSVTEKGYSQGARVAGYYVGGKTGTSQIPNPKGGYSSLTWHTFAGIGPIFDPKFVIIVKLDKPYASEASVTCAPIFHELAKYIFQYWKIPTERDAHEEMKYNPVQ